MSPPDTRPPRWDGAARGKNHRGDDGPCILRHPALARNRDNSLATVCRRTLHELATARRAYRDTVTPDMSDAMDTAMDALSIAAELEVRHG